MKITKFTHSCLLVEMPAPVNRTVLFDPGVFSTYDVDALEYLDDIVITHNHSDHYSVNNIKALVEKFPHVRITATPEIVDDLAAHDIQASSEAPEGVEFFDSPHEQIRPFFPNDPPQEIGVHYLGKLTHPGDSHSFSETKDILALPVQAPWGSANAAVTLGLQLKPKYVLPIHDWHWNDAARQNSYENMEKAFQQAGITFVSLKHGEPVVLDV